MIFNYNIFFKFLLTSIFIFFSVLFFFQGYLELSLEIKDKKDKITTLKIENLKEPKKENEIIIIKNKNQKIINKSQELSEIKIVVKKNDTFSGILSSFFVDSKIKNKLIEALRKDYDLKNLRIGQEIFFYKNKSDVIKRIVIPINYNNDIILEISENNVFTSRKEIKLNKELEAKKFIITSSLYNNGKESGLPLNILTDAIRMFSFDVDFQRDIRKNDELEILYEKIFSDQRKEILYGDIKYIKLRLQKTDIEYFLFKDSEGSIDYFNRKGENNKKALMKTPIDGAKLSSSYGMRKHPISGYNKMHRGTDFAAPIGTPIYAAGNGVIDFVGINGGYGKYIRIRHNSQYKTAYAHLSNFKKGLHKGMRVNQGDTIGYVGSTGMSTGPHLHYEVIYEGKKINPMTMKLPSGKKLTGKELKNFKTEVNKIYSDFLFSLYE